MHRKYGTSGGRLLGIDPMKRTSPLTPYRGGYTLLELLLVLAILVAIAGLWWPSVNGWIADFTV